MLQPPSFLRSCVHACTCLGHTHTHLDSTLVPLQRGLISRATLNNNTYDDHDDEEGGRIEWPGNGGEIRDCQREAGAISRLKDA